MSQYIVVLLWSAFHSCLVRKETLKTQTSFQEHTFRQTKDAARQRWGVAMLYANKRRAEMQPSDMRDSGDLRAVSWTEITGVIQPILNNQDHPKWGHCVNDAFDSYRNDCCLFSSLQVGRLILNSCIFLTWQVGAGTFGCKTLVELLSSLSISGTKISQPLAPGKCPGSQKPHTHTHTCVHIHTPSPFLISFCHH